jgi:hypothetical protein
MIENNRVGKNTGLCDVAEAQPRDDFVDDGVGSVGTKDCEREKRVNVVWKMGVERDAGGEGEDEKERKADGRERGGSKAECKEGES